MAEIKDWKSNTAYDAELMQIPHYQVHPEMMPFVGEHYRATGILLVGESHYIESIDEQSRFWNYYKNNWYEKALPNDFPCADWFNTRGVLHNFLVCRRSRAHSMFGNPAKAAIKAWNLINITDSEVFNAFAFMNYFQKPASLAGTSFCRNQTDDQEAYQVFTAVTKILNPRKVFFLSQKAWDAFWDEHKKHPDHEKLRFEHVVVAHPTCAHWWKNDGRNGQQKFIMHLDCPVNVKFDFIALPKRKDLKATPPAKCMETKKKRFEEDEVYYRLYGDDHIKEIVFYKLIAGRRIGIGYVFAQKIMWVWDYDTKDYWDPQSSERTGKYVDAYPDNSEMQLFYEEARRIIQNIQI